MQQRYLDALAPDVPLDLPDAAVIVATSGSTGRPKGVGLSRDAIAASVAATHERLGGPGLWVCPLPVHHVAGMMTIARGLLGGGGVRLVDSRLADLPVPDARAYLSLVPAQLHRALDDAGTLASLRRYAAVLVGGSAVPDGLCAAARERGVRVVTTYGMSETCGGCVYDGVPLDGVRVTFVTDETGPQDGPPSAEYLRKRRTPGFNPGTRRLRRYSAEGGRDQGGQDGSKRGATDGRIVLAGPMVFSGYRLDPVRTGAVLDGDRVRTQDRGRWHDGRLVVLGRVDDVVVSGGVNVDLAEVQRHADAIWGVDPDRRVVVASVPDPRWGQRVVAVTVGPTTLEQVRAGLGAVGEPAAVPRELRRLKCANPALAGKIDRAAVRAAWEESDGDTA